MLHLYISLQKFDLIHPLSLTQDIVVMLSGITLICLYLLPVQYASL